MHFNDKVIKSTEWFLTKMLIKSLKTDFSQEKYWGAR